MVFFSSIFVHTCAPHKKKSRGFSLIEVLVSLSIFTIVVTISVGSLLVLIGANAKARSMQEVMTNLSFTLDAMTRDIRTGTDYHCQGRGSLPVSGNSVDDCAVNNSFSFNEGGKSLTASTGNDSRRIGYAFHSASNSIVRRLGDGDGSGSNDVFNADWFPITSPNTVITDLRFTVTGADRSSRDTNPPVVTIFIQGYAKEDENQTPFYIETTVTQQILDV